MSERRVVITGLGAVCCLGSDLKKIWEGVLGSRSGIGPIRAFDTTAYDVHFAGECWDFDPQAYLTGKEARRMDRFVQLGVAASEMALADSGIDLSKVNKKRFGCILGSGVGGLTETEAQHSELIRKGPNRVSAFLIPKMMINAAPGQVSIRHGLRGPNFAVVTACASASHAIGSALYSIRSGLSDYVLTGGTEAAVSPLGIAGFCSLKALSRRNDNPPAASRPFDRDRDGFVMAEGAGVLVVEEMDAAKARGARIYAELVGFGASGDGCHITAPDPEGAGMADAMVESLRAAQVSPDSVDYINAHGTSTQLNDAVETLAIKRVFGDHARRLAVSSTKSQIGHLLGASGGVELVITALGVYHQVAPPTINLDTPDPECDLDYVPHHARQMRIDVAMSNSFGFGGHNGSLVIRRFR
jgi:3-oxoacyl-[acyl-carrier-protein] synthase II